MKTQAKHSPDKGGQSDGEEKKLSDSINDLFPLDWNVCWYCKKKIDRKRHRVTFTNMHYPIHNGCFQKMTKNYIENMKYSYKHVSGRI